MWRLCFPEAGPGRRRDEVWEPQLSVLPWQAVGSQGMC